MSVHQNTPLSQVVHPLMGAAPCFGLTCEVRTGYGDELMTLHVMRVMELKGFESFRCPLKYAWPPQISKGDILQHIEDLRTDFLPEQDKKEQEFQEMRNVLALCLIKERQTRRPEICCFEGQWNGSETRHTIQCKNVKWHEKKVWWRSLGVAEDTQPVEECAGYSYCGLEASCELASRRLGLDAQIMAVSYECPATFPLPKDKKLRWWFREMFEPTISEARLRPRTRPRPRTTRTKDKAKDKDDDHTSNAA